MYDCRSSSLSDETLRRIRAWMSISCRFSLFCFEFCPSQLQTILWLTLSKAQKLEHVHGEAHGVLTAVPTTRTE